MKIKRTVYTLEQNTEFDETNIVQTDNRFSIQLSVSQEFGRSNYIVFKNCIVGAFGYLKDKENFDKNIVETFDSLDQCFKAIMNLTKAQIDLAFSKPKNFNEALFTYYNHNL